LLSLFFQISLFREFCGCAFPSVALLISWRSRRAVWITNVCRGIRKRHQL